MEDFNFYKGLYEREISRRKDLDSLVNIPIGIITLMTGLIYFFVKNYPFKNIQCIDVVMIINLLLSSLLILISMIFIAKSYNNFFTGFNYPNFAIPSKLREYQLTLEERNRKIIEYNNKIADGDYELEPKKTLNYETVLIDKFNQFAGEHMRINDTRARDLYIAKLSIVLTMFLLVIGVCIFSTKTYIL